MNGLALNSIVINNTGGDVALVGSQAKFYGYYTWKSGTFTGSNAFAPNTSTAYAPGNLGSLTDNGGPTPTMALSSSAPAYHAGGNAYYNATDGYYFKGTNGLYYKIGAGSTAFTPTNPNPETELITTDQRGATRDTTPSMGACDGVISNPMQLVFTTDGDDSDVALPLFGTVNCTVNWGDGSASETFTSKGLAEHTFALEGTYTVSIIGTVTEFGDISEETWSGHNDLVQIVSFGDIGLTSLLYAFNDCDYITSVPATLPATITNLSYAFYCSDALLTNVNLWDVSHVTNMSGLFYSAENFNSDISGWDVSAVTNMDRMFQYAYSFDQNIGSWDISNVTNMTKMFQYATLSTANYDALLIGWAAQTVKPNVNFNGGNSKYSAGTAATARGVLTSSPNSWIITDGGLSITTAVNDKANMLISIYPNPAKDFVRIKGISGNALVTITDLNGQTCLQQVINANTNVPVNHLSQGIYLLKIQENGTTKRMKLVIK